MTSKSLPSGLITWFLLLAQLHTVAVGAAIGQACLLLAAGSKGKRFMMPHAKGMAQSTLLLSPIWNSSKFPSFSSILFQQWSNSLVSHHLDWCLLVMFSFVQKRLVVMNHPSAEGVSFCIISWAQPLKLESNYSNFKILNAGQLLFQVIANRDTLVKLLAKHTGNVSL